MTAYMDLNGVPAAGNRWLLTEVLRETGASTASWSAMPTPSATWSPTASPPT